MKEKITGKKIAKNLIFSISAQIVALGVNFILGFIVPRYIDEYQYSYWQTYMLYVGYVGIFHFGLFDGLILRYSQYDYDELDQPRIRSQFKILISLLSVFTLIGCGVSFYFISNEYKIIFILVSIGILIKNIYSYNSYTLQFTNRINLYAILVVVYRLVYAIIVIVLLILKIGDFYWYCLADLIGDFSGIIIASFFNKGLYFGKSLSIKESLSEYKRNISAGIILLITGYAANLIVGGAKMVIQWHWGTLTFGKVSFAFSVTNVFLTFVTAISIVLFPSLKRMKEEQLPKLYVQIRNAISPLLFLALLLYFPMCWILEKWLPSYSESLVYIGVLLPIIIFSSKVNLLTNNYLKAYRKEKVMLVINLISVALGFGLALFFAYVVENLDLLLFSVVFVVILRSIASEVVVGKIINRKGIFDYIVELIMTVIFIAVARYLTLWWGCLAYAVALVVYFVLYRKNLISMIHMIKESIQKRKAKKQVAVDEQKEINNDGDIPEK